MSTVLVLRNRPSCVDKDYLRQELVESLLPQATNSPLQSLLETAVLSGRVRVNVSRVLEVGVFGVVACDLNRVTAIEILAVLHLVVILHHWTV